MLNRIPVGFLDGLDSSRDVIGCPKQLMRLTAGVIQEVRIDQQVAVMGELCAAVRAKRIGIFERLFTVASL